jgi:hypothetical protein
MNNPDNTKTDSFCSFQIGANELINYNLKSSYMKVAAMTNTGCSCQKCSQQEIDTGICDSMCADGKECDGAINGVKDEEYVKCSSGGICARYDKCVPCRNIVNYLDQERENKITELLSEGKPVPPELYEPITGAEYECVKLMPDGSIIIPPNAPNGDMQGLSVLYPDVISSVPDQYRCCVPEAQTKNPVTFMKATHASSESELVIWNANADDATECGKPAQGTDCTWCQEVPTIPIDEGELVCRVVLVKGEPGTYCGDGICDSGETAESCPEDCSVCGDNLCTGDETPATCAVDCYDMCIDSDGGRDYYVKGKISARFYLFDEPYLLEEWDACEPGSRHNLYEFICEGDYYATVKYECPGYCEDGACHDAVCGDGFCDPAEDVISCGLDCATSCGDGYCIDDEDAFSCPVDCGASCGDGHCTHAEDASSCPVDCPGFCGDGYCTHSETAVTCSIDCPGSCGDGYCTHSETAVTCPADCDAVCGDGACTHSEDATTCADDCTVCGDGICSGSETATSCAEDCSYCGDGVCNEDEDYATCPADCEPPAAEITGYVFDSLSFTELQDVIVTASTSTDDYTGTSDSTGYYSVEVPGLSTVDIEYSKTGYDTEKQTGIYVPDTGKEMDDVYMTSATGTISGTVTDSATGDPIHNAYVYANPGGYSDATWPNGYYSITLPVGTYNVHGFKMEIKGGIIVYTYPMSTPVSVTVTKDATTTLDIELTPAP